MCKMPIGIENFRELIEGNYYFVDKTLFIKELLDSRSKVTLFTRPRRFGKTLSMSMLKEFFDINAADSDIFAELKISRAGNQYMQHRGKYPVIFLSMKAVAAGGYADTFALLKAIVARLYRQYWFLEKSAAISDDEKKYYVNMRQGNELCSYADLTLSLGNLSNMLYRHYGIKPIVLIDEYDAPVQYAWENGFYDEMISFMRQFYSEALKGNEALEFAVLTGVLRIAKESIFSGLNNLRICSVTSKSFNTAFGFTEEEVSGMTVALRHEDKMPELKEWYNGYNFAGADIYNPWSVIQYFQEGCRAGAYWVNTSGNGIIRQMLRGIEQEQAEDLHSLMKWETVAKQVSEGVIYEDIGKNSDDLYTLLLNAGYLKCVRVRDDLYGQEAELKIPNKEIYSLFGREILANMMSGGAVSGLRKMLDAMLSGNVRAFESVLATIVRNNVSCYDAANGESFYHGMMLGFCVLLKDTHLVESNRESGYGRFDLALMPMDEKYYGVILEFKRAEDEAHLEAKALEALAQIEDLSYIAEFEKRRINKVWKYGIAFCGKRVCLRG
ncbi:AAA family ATPase [Anaerovibrio sp.]|uniref:AAA family ATPase n=1 Tax=Anaerovibrio sp. TaxID=1872532 RepID=UPI003F15DCE4